MLRLVYQHLQDTVTLVSIVLRAQSLQSLMMALWEQSVEKVTTVPTVKKKTAQVAHTRPYRALHFATNAHLASTVTILMVQLTLLSVQQAITAPNLLKNLMCAHSVLTLKQR